MSDDKPAQYTFMPEGEVPYVRKMRNRGAPPPQTYDNVSAGDNANYIDFVLEDGVLPKVDTGDPEAVKERIMQYFEKCKEHDLRPTVNGLSSALGVSRQQLWNWKNGINRPQNYEVINWAYNKLEELWELYMMHGKIYPANAIFLGKNHFGYRDVQDVVVTPNNPLGDKKSAEEIAEQYDYLLTDEEPEE